MYIYIVQNEIDGKRYVGKSKNSPIKRIKNHFDGRGNKHIAAAIKRFGKYWFNFKIEQFYGITDQKLYDIEAYYISMVFDCKYPKGYNLTNGGEKSIGFRSPMWQHEEQICDMYINQKMSTTKIAKVLGSNDGMIYRILSYNNVKFRNNIITRNDVWQNEEQICDMFVDENMSLSEISVHYKCSKPLIRKILMKNGIECSEAVRSNAWNHEKEICRMYATTNLTGKEISEMFDTNKTVVYRILNENNILIGNADVRKSNSAKTEI